MGVTVQERPPNQIKTMLTWKNIPPWRLLLQAGVLLWMLAIMLVYFVLLSSQAHWVVQQAPVLKALHDGLKPLLTAPPAFPPRG